MLHFDAIMPAAKLACPHCESQYTRRDSLRRHIKLHHRGRDLKHLRAVAACAACKARKTRCSGAAPCDFCLERGVQCKYNADDDDDDDDDEQQQQQQQQPSTQKGLSNSQWSPEIDRYVDAYFARVHPTWPFLHKASFSPRRELPFLVQAVVMIGLWATPHERGARQAAVKLHEKMRASILEQQTQWDVSQHLDQEQQRAPWPMGTCQAILLFLIFGSMLETRHLDGDAAAAAGPPPPTHTTDRAILVALVKSARKRGMFNYAKIVARCSSSTTTTATTTTTIPTAASSSSALLCAWTAIEEAKRFAAALHQVRRLCGAFLPEDGDDDADEEGGGSLQQMPAPDADFLWDASDEADLLRRIGEERRRGARTAESEMQVLGTSWDDILREYVGPG